MVLIFGLFTATRSKLNSRLKALGEADQHYIFSDLYSDAIHLFDFLWDVQDCPFGGLSLSVRRALNPSFCNK